MNWTLQISSAVYISLFWLFSLFGSTSAMAQIEAPDLQCISGDSIFFEQVIPSCGPATGLVIFISDMLDGPYRPLATIADLMASEYIHDTTGTFYYFLQTLADCPGESPLSSDTLSNQSVQPIEILSASVEGNGIRVVWRQSDNPNVTDYIIFRSTPSGSISIDTIPDTSYLDLGADISISQSYLVLTRDVCGETSIFPEAHNSIVVDTVLAPCRNEQELIINPYLAWTDEPYAVYVYADNINDALPAEQIGQFASDETILIDNLRNGESYCLYVILENLNSGIQVRSSEICFVPNYNQLVERLEINNLSFLPGQSTRLDVSWEWNTNASISEVAIQTSADTFSFNPTFPLNQFDNRTINSDGGDVINIWTRDSCGNIAVSPLRTAPVLNVSIDQANQVTVQHTGPTLPNNKIFVTSRLLQIEPSGTRVPVENNLGINESLRFDGNEFEDEELCLLVEYTFRDSIDNTTFVSYGPTACVQKFPSLFFPNAFSPNGINFEFRPRTNRRSIEGYTLQIFDRYGQNIFETNEILDGWSGLNENGTPLTGGIYLYKAEIENESYKWETQGTVMLLK